MLSTLKPLAQFVLNVLRVGCYMAVAGAALGTLALLVMTQMPGTSFEGPLPKLTSEQAAMADRMRAHMSVFGVSERNIWRYEKLESSALYLEKQLAEMGYSVVRQEFVVDGQKVRNLEVTISGGSNPERRLVVVGAHYDSAASTHGANDNGSGVVAVLELARSLRNAGPGLKADVQLVLYVNEEPPYFNSDDMGSRVHAKALRARDANVVAMLSLETMGYYSDEAGSQDFPSVPLLRQLFPDKGNFVAFIGDLSAISLVREATGTFRRTTAFPAEGISAPNRIPGINWSDHQGYSMQGYPALMVTDTAPYRYPFYHTDQDTLDKVDFEKLARVTQGVEQVVLDLAGGKR